MSEIERYAKDIRNPEKGVKDIEERTTPPLSRILNLCFAYNDQLIVKLIHQQIHGFLRKYGGTRRDCPMGVTYGRPDQSIAI